MTFLIELMKIKKFIVTSGEVVFVAFVKVLCIDVTVVQWFIWNENIEQTNRGIVVPFLILIIITIDNIIVWLKKVVIRLKKIVSSDALTKPRFLTNKLPFPCWQSTNAINLNAK